MLPWGVSDGKDEIFRCYDSALCVRTCSYDKRGTTTIHTPLKEPADPALAPHRSSDDQRKRASPADSLLRVRVGGPHRPASTRSLEQETVLRPLGTARSGPHVGVCMFLHNMLAVPSTVIAARPNANKTRRGL